MRALKVTDLESDLEVLQKRAALLSRFPESTERQIEPNHLGTAAGRAKAMKQLVSKHGGELAEISPRCSGRVLRRMSQGSAGDAPRLAASANQRRRLPSG